MQSFLYKEAGNGINKTCLRVYVSEKLELFPPG